MNDQKNSFQGGPLLLTKKDLAAKFGLIRPCGQYSTKMLYSKILTPDVLATAGLTEADCRKGSFRTFTATQSLLIRSALGI